MKTLDMRGQPCPIPVVNAKQALAGPDPAVAVVVDNMAAVQNLEKMARGTGCGFSYAQEGEARYRVSVVKGGQALPAVPADPLPPEKAGRGPVVLITADTMGRGDDDLGRLLIKGFIFSLTQLSPPPEAVIFLNAGARLTTEGANAVPDLRDLEGKGAEILTCGTCANYYNLAGSLAVGSIADMLTIASRLAGASSVITI